MGWVDISYARASSQPRDRTCALMSLTLADRFFTTSTTWDGPMVLSVRSTAGGAPACRAGRDKSVEVWTAYEREESREQSRWGGGP